MNCSIDNLEELDTYFRSYKAIPTACNVQLIFYRPKKSRTSLLPPLPSDDVLVKALLNENEVTLPVETDKFPYYKWSDVRVYYLEKLKKQPKSPFPNMPQQTQQIPSFFLQMMNGSQN